jgi:hypothetical protein
LTAIEALTPSADTFPYYTGANSAALATLTSYIRTLLDDTTAAAARTTLTLGTGDSPTFTGLTLTGDLSVQGSSTLGNGTAADSVTVNAATFDYAGLGTRIKGDFSNATRANRAMFQDRTTNNQTQVSALPNGTSTSALFAVYGGSDPDNTNFGQFIANATNVAINSSFAGTGVQQPLAFQIAGTSYVILGTGGNLGLGVGPTTIPARLSILGSNSATTNDLTFTSDASGNYRNGIATEFSAVVASGNKLHFLLSDATATGQASILSMQGDGAIILNVAGAIRRNVSNSFLDLQSGADGLGGLIRLIGSGSSSLARIQQGSGLATTQLEVKDGAFEFSGTNNSPLRAGDGTAAAPTVLVPVCWQYRQRHVPVGVR